MTAPFLSGIRSLAERYDTFVVDLWGTLHNGIQAYPGAIDALARLEAAGKRVALLSNAPRRAAAAEKTLAAVGIEPHHYALLVTAGEAAHTALRDRPDDWHRKLQGPCWHLGPIRDRSVFEGLDLDILEKPEGAGFCLVTGTRLDLEVVEDYRPELDFAFRRGLPMICANPDLVVPAGDMLVVCAGAFAAYYSELGGDVFWHGKPHKPIYERVFAGLEAVGGPVDLARTIAIGDALATDIGGAAAAGIASGLLVGGVEASDLRLHWRGRPNKKALARLLEDSPAKPDYVLKRFAW